MKSLVVALAAIVFVAAAYESFAAGEKPGDSAAKIGSPAPQFALSDQSGKSVSLKDYADKVVVLEWTNPQCPFVLRHYKAKTMQTLAGAYGPKGVAWLAINSTKNTTNESDMKWAAEQGINYPVLNDVATDVGKAYHATNTPEMYIIGKDGTLLYKGAIDNDEEGDKAASAKVNYVQKALDEILAGQTVSQPETKAYGCAVHYAH